MADKNRVWMRQKDFDDLGQDAGWCNVYSYEPAPPSREATLVVHEGKAERVFTESEVRAMLMRVDQAGRKPFSAEQVKLLRAEGFEVETDVPFSDPA